MIYLSYLDPQTGPRTVSFETEPVRFGRGASCDVRLSGSAAEVAVQHGEIVCEGERYFVVAREKRYPVWVNGKPAARAELFGGERIRVGASNGPEIRIIRVTGVEESPFDEIEATVRVAIKDLENEAKARASSKSERPGDAPTRVAPKALPVGKRATPAESPRTSNAGSKHAVPPPLIPRTPLPPRSDSGSARSTSRDPRAATPLPPSEDGSGPRLSSPNLRRSDAAEPRGTASVARRSAGASSSLPPFSEPDAPRMSSPGQPRGTASLPRAPTPLPPRAAGGEAQSASTSVPSPLEQSAPWATAPGPRRSDPGEKSRTDSLPPRAFAQRTPVPPAEDAPASPRINTPSSRPLTPAADELAALLQAHPLPEPGGEPPRRNTGEPRLSMPLADAAPSIPLGEGKESRTMMRALKALRKPHKEVQHWLSRVQAEVAQARAQTDGLSSGNTMVIMAQALVGIRQTAEGRAQKLRRRMIILAAASVLLVLGLGSVVWLQHRRLTQLASEKVALDAEIQTTLDAMSNETDEEKLAQLEGKLQSLMGSAADKLRDLSKANAKRAEELTKPTDPMEEEIRKILRSFNAETYAIPPIFKAQMKKRVAELSNSSSLRQAYARKRKYWPDIEKALREKQLPEELGYIAYAESGFDPQAQNSRSQASGMWQLMDETARNCGITVNQKVDERFDTSRSSEAAACYLSKLMVEFGQESFMLALASYNRGENGVRRALHRLAKEPGGYKKRDFWHLYRLKLLPEETREYVPKVLAAAVVLGNPRKYGLDRPN